MQAPAKGLCRGEVVSSRSGARAFVFHDGRGGPTLGTQWVSRTVKQLVDAKNRQGDEHFTIPYFQRTLQWGDAKKDNLLRSLQLDYPIGALLLYLDPQLTASNRKTTYLVVDGLQRISALDRYVSSPLRNFQLSGMNQTRLGHFRGAAIEAASNELDPEQADELLRDWLKTQDPNSEKFDAYTLAGFFKSQAGCDGSEEFIEACQLVVHEIRNGWNLSEKAIPVLIYDGPRQTLADVFQSLNTGGKPLSIYDILNALWERDVTLEPRKEIREAVAARYKSLEDEGYTVEDRGDRGFNLYEYLLGLGKYVISGKAVKDAGFLFSDTKRGQDQADSVLFAVVSVLYGLRWSEMADLPSKMPMHGEAIDFRGFEKALLDSIAFVRDALSAYADFEFRGTRGGTAHTELQLASLVARVLAGKYDPSTWSVRPTWQAEGRELKRNIPRYYLYDAIRSNWSGSGDSRLFNMVWSSDGAGLSSHYLQPLSDAVLTSALSEYFEASLRVLAKERKSASPADRLILKYAYRDSLKMKHFKTPADIEHLMPVALLKGLVAETGDQEGWPINSIGNYAVLDKKTNREKHGTTLADYVAHDPAERERIQGYLFLPVSRVSVPRPDGHPSMTKEEYVDFLRVSFDAMTGHVLRTLGA